MRPKARSGSRLGSLRKIAESRVAQKRGPDLDALTPGEVRALLHELEIHKVELQIQNEQLTETQLTLEASKERYRQLYEGAPIGYVTLDREGAIVEANLTASELLRVPRARLVGCKLSRFVARTDQDRWHVERRAMALEAERRNLELQFVLPDGTALRVQLVGSGTPEVGGAPGAIHLALLDVTELRSVELALRAAAGAAATAEQRERRALAADLHDDAGQLLALASLKLRALGDTVIGERTAGRLELEELLAETRRRISSLSFQLSPPLLHDVGLIAAAQWLAEEKERRFGLVVRIVKGEELELDEIVRVTLFRALQELLVNVAKHARAGGARVRIWRDADVARVEVTDSGVGFEPAASHRGFGLLALRDRVQQMGGSLEIESAFGRGTRVVASMPCTIEGADAEGGAT